ncbi:MAG: Wzz/FepE/Etk N-terminal domain-containing protein [Bacteroidales bacterium]|nr:Wzz/FepE/Etk N-terminal domain-containing protein [Bacteroidales bacterium]
MNEKINNVPIEEEGIDYKAILMRFWAKRKYILYVCGAFAALGLLVAIFQRPVYTSTCTFVPLSSSSKASTSSLSSLAAMAGINLGDMSAGESLSPLIYPQILGSVEFNKELMRVPLHFEDYDEPVSLYDLATDPQYRRFTVGGVFKLIKKYTIGLPFVILNAIRGEQPDIVVSGGEEKKISAFTKDEYKVYESLSKMLSLTVEKKDGYLTLSAKSSEALVAAELCQGALNLMQKYISDFKHNQAKDNLAYLQARSNETRDVYIAKQMELAQYVDSNRGAQTATSETRREQLSSEYNLAFALYTEVSKQLLQAELKVKNDTPVLSAVKPVDVPMKKSNSRMKTLFVWVFFGIVVSLGSVLGLDWLKKHEVKYPFSKPARLKSFYEEWE